MTYWIRVQGAQKDTNQSAALYLARMPDELLVYFGVKPGERLLTVRNEKNGTLIVFSDGLTGYKVNKASNVSAVCLWRSHELNRWGGRLPITVAATKITHNGKPALRLGMSDINYSLKGAAFSNQARDRDPGVKYRTPRAKENPNGPGHDVMEEGNWKNALKVARLLSEVFDPDKGVYDGEHNDKTIATELDLSLTFVQSCREEEYGPLANGHHEELKAIKAELQTLQTLVQEQIKRLDSLLQS